MKITVTSGPFAAALRRVALLMPDRVTIPIVATVKLEASPQGLAVTASDLTNWLVEWVDTTPRDSWSGCVDGERLAGLAKSLAKGGEITLNAKDETLNIMSGGVAARFGVLHAEEFPGLPRHNEEPATCFEVAADKLRATLKFCSHVISDPDDARYYLQGVHLSADGVAAATDGHRMALCQLTGLAAPDNGAIVPVTTCKRLVALLRETEDIVSVTLTSRHASFAGGQWKLTSKLIDGRYPDYRRVAPPRSAAPAVVNRASLAAAIERTKLILHGAGEKSRAVRLRVENSALTITAGQAIAAIEEVIDLAGETKAVTVAINGHYLEKGLEVLEGDHIEIHLGKPLQAFWICTKGEPHDGIIITPMKW